MAVGKNKRISKGRKGAKKKIFDPFTKKDWYDIKAPAPFTNKNVGKTIVSRTVGTKIASDGLKHRVVPVNLADLNSDESHAHVNFKLRIEDVQGTNCLTNFWGMSLTTDKLRFLVKKWQTLIESHSDVKTTDGYHLRLFIIGFTKKLHNQRKTFYAQTAQVKQIRKKMMDITVKESTTCTLKELVEKLIPNGIGKLIEKECHGIYPIQNVYVRKVKVLKAPKFDAYKLLELHGETVAQAAKEAEKPKKEAPKKEAPKKEAKKEAKKAAPKKDAPKKDASKKDAPKKDAPKKEAKKAEEAKPKAEETGTKVERPQKK